MGGERMRWEKREEEEKEREKRTFKRELDLF